MQAGRPAPRRARVLPPLARPFGIALRRRLFPSCAPLAQVCLLLAAADTAAEPSESRPLCSRLDPPSLTPEPPAHPPPEAGHLLSDSRVRASRGHSAPAPVSPVLGPSSSSCCLRLSFSLSLSRDSRFFRRASPRLAPLRTLPARCRPVLRMVTRMATLCMRWSRRAKATSPSTRTTTW